MALMTTTGQVPKGAIELNRAEAVSYQWQQIYNWPNSFDVWPYRYGLAVLSIVAAGSGAKINSMYRIKLKLGNYGFVTTSFPMILTPALLSVGIHAQIVSNDLILRDTKCPLCLQFRGALIQMGISSLYPMVLSPIANFMFATRHGTYRLPEYWDVRGTLKLWWKFTKPMGYTLFTLAFIQGLAGSVITYFEGKCIYNLQAKLLMLQEEAEIRRSQNRQLKESNENSL